MRFSIPRYSAPIATHRIAAVVLAALAVAVVGGCGGGEEALEPKTVSSSDGDRAIPTTVQRTPEEAGEFVIAVWGQLKAGDIPDLVASYHPRVLNTVGAEHLAEALAGRQVSIAAQELRKAHVSETRLGWLVRLETTGATKTDFSYLVREGQGRWVILHDSILIDAVQSYVQGQVQATVDPTARTPSQRAQRAGAAAAKRIRSLFLPRARGDLDALLRRFSE